MDAAYYQSQILRTQEGCPFLWGPVHNALLLEWRHGNMALVERLCKAESMSVKQMMVSVLSDLGQDDKERTQVESLLRQLLPPARPSNSLQNAWRLVHPPTTATDSSTRNARKIAVEVAANLRILWALEAAAIHPDPSIRTAAVRHGYYMWQHDHVAGFALLNNLAKATTSSLVPYLTGFEAVLGLSLVIFFDHPQDASVLSPLQGIWRGIIDKTLRLSGNRWGQAPRDFFREQIFSLIITLLFRTLDEMPDYGMNKYDLAAFFRLGISGKALYRRLTKYIDAHGPYSRQELEHDVLQTLELVNNDILVEYVLGAVLNAQLMAQPLDFLPFLKEFFAAGLRNPHPTRYLFPDVVAVTFTLWRGSMIDELFEFMVYATDVCQQYYTQHPQIPGMHSKISPPGAMFISDYASYQYRKIRTIRTGWIEQRINDALQRDDGAFFYNLIKEQLSMLAVDRREPEVALEMVALLFEYKEAKAYQSCEIEGMIQLLLARMRLFYRDLIDDFLEGHPLSEEMRLYIETHEPDEKIGELIGVRSGALFLDVVDHSPVLRAQIIRTLAKAADCKDLREWFDYILREAVNLIYGGEALRPAK